MELRRHGFMAKKLPSKTPAGSHAAHYIASCRFNQAARVYRKSVGDFVVILSGSVPNLSLQRETSEESPPCDAETLRWILAAAEFTATTRSELALSATKG